MIYQKPLSYRPETHGDFERKQAPCASNWAPFSSSRCCSVGAGECAGHPGTGSGRCLKMFFLQAGSYVLPRRNENKAPKGSWGSLGAALLEPCLEEGRMGALCGAPRVQAGQAQQGTVLRAAHVSSSPSQGICSGPSLSWITCRLSLLAALACFSESMLRHLQTAQENLESKS